MTLARTALGFFPAAISACAAAVTLAALPLAAKISPFFFEQRRTPRRAAAVQQSGMEKAETKNITWVVKSRQKNLMFIQMCPNRASEKWFDTESILEQMSLRIYTNMFFSVMHFLMGKCISRPENSPSLWRFANFCPFFVNRPPNQTTFSVTLSSPRSTPTANLGRAAHKRREIISFHPS